MRSLYRAGLAVTGGNVSARLESDQFAITPAGASADRMGELEASDLVTVSMSPDKDMTDGPSSETPVHRALYQKLPWCCGIVHAHAVYSLALDPVPADWPQATASSSSFGSSILGAPRSASHSELALWADSRLDTFQAGAALKYGLAIFIPDHGIFAAAISAQRALYFVNKIEENAVLSVLRSQAGRNTS